MAMLPGKRLGPYEILSAIGAGGMGEVYRARDTRLDRIVAIKVLPAHLADEPERRERFEREARTIASLNHPHICTLYDIGRQDGTDFLVMEYLEGETLAQRLLKGPLPLDQVLQYAIEIADALDKAHRKGVTHRDLKPSNIMLTKSGSKLLDFGLAKLKQEKAPVSISLSKLSTAQDNLTAQGTILGTLQYMAPEQVEGKEVDARTDIFAFGAVVYEMATGRKAFEGQTQASLIAAILEREPPAMSSLQPMTPPALDRVVKKCLRKDPDERWQSARDVTDELKWIAESGSQVALAPTDSAKGIRALGRRALLLNAGTLL
jgi:eukaryotic-like serine/threonine-protein kinase